MNTKNLHQLFIICYLVVGIQAIVLGVTDAELEALEQQIEQQEILDKEKEEAERKAKEEAKRLAEEKKRLDEQRKQLEDERKKIEELRKAELEKKQQQEAKQKAEQEKRKKYNLLIAEAEQAMNEKDKELAINKYNEALLLFPNDTNAVTGLNKAHELKHKVCYEVLGLWIWDKAFGKETIVLNENGTIDYQTSIKGSGSWDCIDPEKRIIKIRLSAAGFSNEWMSEYSLDGTCLTGPETWGERGCYHRKNSHKENEKISPQKKSVTPKL